MTGIVPNINLTEKEALLMMVRFTFDDGTGTVDLFGEGETYHLVGEGKTIRTTDDEDESTDGVAFLFQPTGELHATILLAVLIEEDNGVRGLQHLEDQLTLRLLLLVFREVLGVLELRNGHKLEGHIVIDALHIIINTRYEMLIDGLTDLYQQCFHRLPQ